MELLGFCRVPTHNQVAYARETLVFHGVGMEVLTSVQGILGFVEHKIDSFSAINFVAQVHTIRVKRSTVLWGVSYAPSQLQSRTLRWLG